MGDPAHFYNLWLQIPNHLIILVLQLVSAHFYNLWLQIQTQILVIYMFLKCVTFSEKSPSVTSRKNGMGPKEIIYFLQINEYQYIRK